MVWCKANKLVFEVSILVRGTLLSVACDIPAARKTYVYFLPVNCIRQLLQSILKLAHRLV